MSKYLELVGGSFTQEHFDKQAVENKPYVAYSIKDSKVIYTIVPNEDGTYKVILAKSQDTPKYDPIMVDLGLSVKWADRNVGASDTDDYGMYYAWGETNGVKYLGTQKLGLKEMLELFSALSGEDMTGLSKEDFDSIFAEVGITDGDLTVMGVCFTDKAFNWDNYFDTTDGGSTFTKYSIDESKLKVLESDDDVAYVSSNGKCRMPTIDEIQELLENTTHTFIDLQGNEYSEEQAENGTIEEGKLKGVRFTGSNGNSIFIPAAGFCLETVLSYLDSYGGFWSSSLQEYGIGDSARKLSFNYINGVINNSSGGSREAGESVRGVQA